MMQRVVVRSTREQCYYIVDVKGRVVFFNDKFSSVSREEILRALAKLNHGTVARAWEQGKTFAKKNTELR